MKLEELHFSKKHIYIIVSIILLPLLILSFIKLLPTNRNYNKLKKYGGIVQELNMSLENNITENSFSSDSTVELLNNNTNELNKIKTDLASLNTPSKNLEIQEKLLEVVNYNISLNTISLNVIQTPDSSNLSQWINEYNLTFEHLENSCNDIQSYGINISFNKEKNTFYSNLATYTNTLIKINREKDIKSSQKNNYVSNLDECVTTLENMDEDLRPALEKIREEGRSLDTLLVDVKDKRTKYIELKTKSYSFTIPENGNECYEKLTDTLNYYDLYISSLEQSIIEEKNKGNIADENIQKNYENSFSKYEDFFNSFKEFKDEIEIYNKK